MGLSFKENKIWYPLTLLCIALVGLGFRFQMLAERPLWGDELYQLQRTLGPFKSIVQHQNYGDFSSFPGDYLLTYPFVRVFGMEQNKWGMALPHILLTIWSFICLKLIADRWFKTAAGGIVLFLVIAFNQNLIFHSFELRPYALLPVLSLTTFYFTDLIFKDMEKLGRLNVYLLAIYFFAFILAHQYCVLIFGLNIAYFFLREESFWRKKRSQLLYFGLISFCAFFPWFWYTVGTAVEGTYILTQPEMAVTTFEYIPNPIVDFIGFLKGVVGNLIGFKYFYLFLIGAAALFLKANELRLQQFAFLCLLVILPVELVLFSSLKLKYWFVQRQFVWVMPLFAIWLAWMCDTLWLKVRPSLLKNN